MLSENGKEMNKDQSSLPQLGQAPSSTYFVYNCFYPVVQDFMNQPPQLQDAGESFPQLITKGDSIQLSHLGPGVSMPSLQFGQQPFVSQDDVAKNLHPQDSLSVFILNQQLKQFNQPNRNRIIEGTQTLCDIEIVLISRYFDMKAHVFCPPNNKYTLKEDTNISNSEWLKDRMSFRYKKPIKESFVNMIDALEKENENNIKQMIQPVKFTQNGFDSIERQVPKSVKNEKPFSMFILEIQQLISVFLFTKY